MKRLMFLFLPLLLNAESLQDILKKIENNLLLKSKNYEILAKKSLYKTAKGENLPKIDASLNAIYLKETPTMSIHLPMPGMPQNFQAASLNQYRGEISLKYPIFTGFATTNLIEKAKLDIEKTKLEKMDIKRNLYMRAIALYSAIFALKSSIRAAKAAMKSLNLSYKKAKGFYEQGLIPISEVYNIEAKKYEIKADLEELISQKETMLNNLEYLTNSKIEKIDGIFDFDIKNIKVDLEDREDIKAIKKALQMDEKDIQIAKSKFYPKIVAIAAIRGYGDSLKFEGDGYRNGDESYAGFIIQQNIFNGLSDKYAIEASKYKKLSKEVYLIDYKKAVVTKIRNDFNRLKYLKTKLKWAQKELKAAKSYFDLTNERFKNQLSSADELSRAIAKLFEARAKKASIKSQIFNSKCKIALEISLKFFEKEFLKNKI